MLYFYWSKSDQGSLLKRLEVMNKSAYIGSLTPLRGLAAIWVVVYHFDQLTTFVGFDHLISPDETTMVMAKGYLCVDFFFLLSGFIMTHVYGTRLSEGLNGRVIKNYLWARFTRIYPLHIFCLVTHVVFFLCLLTGFPSIAEKFSFMYLWEALPLHLVLGEAWGSSYWFTWNVPAWSISAEWIVYVLSVFLFPFLYYRKQVAMVVTTMLSMSALALIINLSDKHTLDVTYDYGSLRCLAEFSLGIVLYRLYQSNAVKYWLGKDMNFVAASLLILVLMHGTLSDLFLIPAFGILILCAACNKGRVRKVMGLKPLKFLGNISYSIYMMQGLWLSMYWIIADTWAVNHPGEVLSVPVLFLCMGVLLALNILSAAASYRYVEIPAREWLRNLQEKPLHEVIVKP